MAYGQAPGTSLKRLGLENYEKLAVDKTQSK
jgi:hypothetical protein